MASRGELACNVPHRAVVARIHGLQQFEGLRSAHLADDDALGPRAQTVFDEISHGDLALEIGGRVSSRTTCGCGSCSSAEPSQVMMHSS